MTTELVSLRMPKQLLQDSENIAHERGFVSVQEYLREAIRKDIEKIKEQKLRTQLDTIIAQSGTRKKKLTAKNRDDLAKEFIKNIKP